MSDKTLEKTLLYDFYGELLTDKQRAYFDLYYNEDLSLGEIAENAGITRQGVYDTLARAEALLCEIERKTGAVARFSEMQAGIAQAEALTLEVERFCPEGEGKKALRALQSLLRQLKG